MTQEMPLDISSLGLDLIRRDGRLTFPSYEQIPSTLWAWEVDTCCATLGKNRSIVTLTKRVTDNPSFLIEQG